MPMALFYEVTLFIINNSDTDGIRNSADIMLKRILAHVGFQGFPASIILFLLVFITVSLIHRVKFRGGEFEWIHFPVLVLESAFYAMIMIFFFAYILRTHVMLSGSVPQLRHVVYSMGAGVYEELLFRGILLEGLLLIFSRLKSVYHGFLTALAVLISSLVFVGIHYMGTFGDTFTYTSFAIRFLGSLMLSAIYLWRGFAAAAYSHMFYDIFVVLI